MVEQYEREHLTYWGSFSNKICQKLTAKVSLNSFSVESFSHDDSFQNPRIVRFCSLKEAAVIVIAYWTGLLPFIRLTPGKWLTEL